MPIKLLGTVIQGCGGGGRGVGGAYRYTIEGVSPAIFSVHSVSGNVIL